MKRHDYYVLRTLVDAYLKTEEALEELISAEGQVLELDARFDEFKNEISMLVDQFIELNKKLDALIDKMVKVVQNES